MKKIIPIMLSVLILCGVIALVACTKKDETPAEKIEYDMRLDLREDNLLEASQTVRFVNVYRDGLNEAVFHLYPNCYAEDACDKAYNGFLDSYGGIEVQKVTVGGAETTFSSDENKEYLTVPLSNVAKGDSVTIGFEYTVTIPESRLRFGCYNGVYALTSFYPQLAVYSEDGFLKDAFTTVGDPMYSSAACYHVELTCPSNLVVASSAKISNREIGEETSVYTCDGNYIRDFAFVACGDFQVLTDTVCDTEISYFYLDDVQAEQNFSTVKAAFEAFDGAFGSAELDSYSVVCIPFDYSGMEYSGLVLVSQSAGSETTDVLLHETAHQWWYNLVGNDSVRQSALDEGLASFCTAYYYDLIGDTETFETKMTAIKKTYTRYETLQKRRQTGLKLNLDGSLYDYTSYQYTMLMYYKSCMMFDSLYELYGKEKTNQCLATFAKEYAHKTATMSDFVNVCNKCLKTDVGGLISGWMGEGTTATTFAETILTEE